MRVRGRLVSLVAVVLLTMGAATSVAVADVPAGDANVSVDVVYANGSAAVGLRVYLCQGSLAQYGLTGFATYCSFLPFATAVTDGAGHASFSGIASGNYLVGVYALNLPPGQSLPASADPYAMTTSTPAFDVAPGATATQSISMPQGGKVSGRLLDPNGQPIAGQVYLCPGGSANGGCVGSGSTVATAADGTYESGVVQAGSSASYIAGIPPGYNFGTYFAGYTFGVPVTAGQTTTGVDVALDAGGTISGHVVGTGGVPITGIPVSVTSYADTASPHFATRCFPPCGASTTDATGAYSVRTASGSVALTVRPTGGSPYIAKTVQDVGVVTAGNVTTGATVQLDVGAALKANVNAPGLSYHGPVACLAPSVPSGTDCVNPSTGAHVPPAGVVSGPTSTPDALNGLAAPATYNIAALGTNNLQTFYFSPTISRTVAVGDVLNCNFTIDATGATPGSSTCTVGSGGGSNSSTVPAAVGGGTVTVSAPNGTTVSGLTATDPATLPTPPPGVTLPAGVLAFTVNGVAVGGSVDVTIQYSAGAQVPNGYAKYENGTWTDASNLVTAISSTSLTVHLTDGGPGDADGQANGTIVDPGGPAVFDHSPPVVSLGGVQDGATYTLGAVPTATCSASDAGAGLNAPCTTSTTGGNANGVGTFTTTTTATDRAGNTATATATYKVIYRFDGYLQPINDTAHQTGVATSIFKAGSTVPVKLQLKRADGTLVQAVNAPVWVTPAKGSLMSSSVDESVYSDPTDSSQTLRLSGDHYEYNWGTDKIQSGYYWRVAVRLDDGTTRTVNVGLR